MLLWFTQRETPEDFLQIFSQHSSQWHPKETLLRHKSYAFALAANDGAPPGHTAVYGNATSTPGWIPEGLPPIFLGCSAKVSYGTSWVRHLNVPKALVQAPDCSWCHFCPKNGNGGMIEPTMLYKTEKTILVNLFSHSFFNGFSLLRFHHAAMGWLGWLPQVPEAPMPAWLDHSWLRRREAERCGWRQMAPSGFVETQFQLFQKQSNPMYQPFGTFQIFLALNLFWKNPCWHILVSQVHLAKCKTCELAEKTDGEPLDHCRGVD